MDHRSVLFAGCAPALVTPFRDGHIDEAAFLNMLERQLEGGCKALVICGTTGESATLTDAERSQLLRLAVQTTRPGIPVIAGAGSNDTQKALQLIRIAEEAGADGLLLVTPYYNKTTQTGLIDHFSYLADRTELPILLYEVPSRTGITIMPETMAILSQHERIWGIKEAGVDLDRITVAISKCEQDFAVYSGNDSLAIPLFALGAIGLISVASNLLPGEFGQLCEFALNGQFPQAAEMHYRYLELMDLLFSEVNPIPVKEALSMMGLCSSEVRLPLVSMSEPNRICLKDCMMKLKLL